jgi:lipoprotein-anchoring transpeptidase ErfK/SrfK
MNSENSGPAQANNGIHPTRGTIAVAIVSVAVVATAAGLLASSNGRALNSRVLSGRVLSGRAGPLAARPAGAVPARQTSISAPAGTTEVATVLNSALRYSVPGLLATGSDPSSIPPTWYGRPSVLPVIAAKPGWVEVRLAQRPNESTAWLASSEVRLGSTPYRIVINVGTMHLSLYDHGKQVLSAPAGVGTADDPTPAGQFFVAFDEPPLSPGYGAFVMVTSAHSPSISDWEDSGDAVIGIHGPLGEDGAIGTTGARVSHGCVRLHDTALRQLAAVPAGTPVDIVS